MSDIEAVRLLEECALNAWPSLRTVTVGGWVMRLSRGYTKRANSLNALAPSLPFAEILPVAEAFYERHGLPTIVRLSPLAPEEADALLDRADYALRDPSIVMTAPLPSIGGSRRDGIDIATHASPQWLDGVGDANQMDQATRTLHAALIGAIAFPALFATIWENGVAVAFGMAVRERGRVGLFDLIVDRAHRRRGFGRAIATALMNRAREDGAQIAYLQVHEGNAVALDLYHSLGFAEAYRYHYRVAG